MHYRFLLFVTLLLITAAPLVAQDWTYAASCRTPSDPHSLAEREPRDAPPRLSGTEADVTAWLADRLEYPDAAREYGIEGRVIVSYVVTTEGKVSEVAIHQGIGYGCDAAVLKLFDAMPRWEPAVRGGRRVDRRCYTPVDFSLR